MRWRNCTRWSRAMRCNFAAWRTGGEIALGGRNFKFARDWTGEAVRYAAGRFCGCRECGEALLLNGDMAAALELWGRV